jgi:hypothetical protein
MTKGNESHLWLPNNFLSERSSKMKLRCLLVGVVVLTFIVSMVGSSHAAIAPESVLGVWLFNDVTGATVKDAYKTAKDGTIGGSPKLVAGKFGKALEFNGTSDYVNVPVNLNNNKEVTAVVWTYTHALPPGERYQIFSNDGGSYGRCVQIRPANYWIFHTEGQAITYAVVPTLNAWEHIAVTWTTTATKLYINGKLVATSVGDTATYNDGTTVNIGSNLSKKDFYDGDLDEAALFGVALADADIANIVSNGLEKTLGIATVSAVSNAGKLATAWANIKSNTGF